MPPKRDLVDQNVIYDPEDDTPIPNAILHEDGGSNSTNLISIVIKVNENTALGSINTDNCNGERDPDWHVYPERNQTLSISVTTEEQNTGSSDGELGTVGDRIGLVQTLIASKRVATYEGGGKMFVIPDVELPCLDGKRDTVPWFDNQCGPESLPAPGGEAVSFYLTDGPTTTVPAKAKHPADPEGVDRVIEELVVEEKFLITLWNQTKGKIVAQWEWGYGYTVKAYNIREVDFQGNEAGEKGSGELNVGIKTDADAGIAGSTFNGWTHGFSHEDAVWEDEGGDLPADDQDEMSSQAADDALAAATGDTEEIRLEDDPTTDEPETERAEEISAEQDDRVELPADDKDEISSQTAADALADATRVPEDIKLGNVPTDEQEMDEREQPPAEEDKESTTEGVEGIPVEQDEEEDHKDTNADAKYGE